MLKRSFIATLISLFLVVSASSCGSSTKPKPKPKPTPTFNLSSRPVPGDPTLMTFSVSCDMDVNLIKAVVTNPESVDITYNLGNSLVVANQQIDLQAEGYAYYRVGGQWSFRFVGTLAAGDDAGSSFDVVTTMDVSGKPLGDPLGSIGRQF